MARERGLAEDLRTRLSDGSSADGSSTVSKPNLKVISGMKANVVDPLSELSFGKPIRQHIREFGAVFGLLFSIIAAIKAYRHPELFAYAGLWAIAAASVYLISVNAPMVVKPLWRAWMGLAHVLGLVMTTVILGFIWILFMIPFAIGLKVAKIAVMDMSFRKAVPSYWENRTDAEGEFKLLERQY